MSTRRGRNRWVIVITCIFGEQTVSQKRRKTPSKRRKSRQKGAKAHVGISALTCFCDTVLLYHFRLHNGQKTVVDSLKFWKPTIWLARTSKEWFVWLTCCNWKSSSDWSDYIDLQLCFLGNTRQTFPKRGRKNARQKNMFLWKRPKRQKVHNLCFFWGFRVIYPIYIH